MSETGEKTFKSFTASDGKAYHIGRPAYAPALYELILLHHASTSGGFTTLLDVGCGPGKATRDLATRFEKVLGIDAGKGMIEAARELGGKTKSGGDIRYEVASAEAFAGIEGLEGECVDLLTVATAAHWFDMPKFWKEAAKVVKPGGTVAIWIRGESYPHPATPNFAKVREILGNFRDVTLKPWTLPESETAKNLYDDLCKPWEMSLPVTEFPESEYVKHEFDRGGVLSNGESFWGGDVKATLKQAEMGIRTASSVVRWSEEHPELVGGEQDIVKVLIAELREALQGEESVIQGSETVILLFTKAK